MDALDIVRNLNRINSSPIYVSDWGEYKARMARQDAMIEERGLDAKIEHIIPIGQALEVKNFLNKVKVISREK